MKAVDIRTVDSDFDAWKEYAYKAGVHPSIITFLEIKKGDFYKVESTVDGKSFVTAREWDDLSQMIILYEKNKIKVDEKLIRQYLQNGKIAKDFAVYYDLFNKYRSDYQVEKILEGKAPTDIKKRAKDAKFDERLSLMGLILEAITGTVKQSMIMDQVIRKDMEVLRKFRADSISSKKAPSELLESYIDKEQDALDKGKKAGSISALDQQIIKKHISCLENQKTLVIDETDGNGAFIVLKKNFDNMVKELKTESDATKKKMNNVFKFLEDAYGEGQEAKQRLEQYCDLMGLSKSEVLTEAIMKLDIDEAKKAAADQ